MAPGRGSGHEARAWRLRAARHGLPALALLLAAAMVAAPYQMRGPQRLVLGSEAAAPYLSGFSFPETAADGSAYRWSEGEAAIRFTGTGNSPLALRLHLHAARPGASPEVTVLANDTTVAVLRPGGQFTAYDVVVPPAAAGWRGEVVLALRVEPFVAPPDTRALGVALASVELAPLGPVLPPATVLSPVLLAVVGLATLWRARPGRWLLPAAAAAALLAAGWARVWPEQAASTLWLLPAVSWLGGAVAIAGPPLARRLRAARERRPAAFRLALLALVAAAVYLPLARTTGYWGDIEIYMAWTHQVVHHGIHSAYSPDFVAPPNTTPVLLYPFWVAGRIFQGLYSPEFPPPWIDRSGQQYLRFLLRLPALLAVALIASALFLYLRRRGGERLALVAVAAYVFNPGVIFEAPIYGQMGGVHALFMLLAVIALAEGRPGRGWAALAVGMLTKPQAYVFLPLFLVYTWRHLGGRAWWRAGAAAAATSAVVLAPFLYHGTLGQMWERISRVADYHPMLSATAHNLWWLVSLGQGTLSDLLAPAWLPFASYRLIGLGLFGLAYLLVLARLWGDGSPGTLYRASAYVFLAFFMLATQIHENHLIPMFPLLLLVALRDRRLLAVYAAFSVTTAINMFLHYPQVLQVLVPANPSVWGGPELALPRWLNSLAQVSLFAYWTVLFGRETKTAIARGGREGSRLA